MKILHIATYDIQGGAARAAYRLHKGLRQLKQDSQILVRYKTSSDETVSAVTEPASTPEIFFLETVIQLYYLDTHRTPRSDTLFSLPYPGFDLSTLSIVQSADIINLHWTARFQSPVTLQKLLKLGKPVIWTLHDQWAFSGGCHYSAGCEGYHLLCTDCPQLTEDLQGIPEIILKDKIALLDKANLTIVTPSHWLAACVRESALFKNKRVEVIPYGLETDIFRPIPKAEAKINLGLTADTTTLLFGAIDAHEKRKGFQHLLAAVRQCVSTPDWQKLIKSEKLKILCLGRGVDELRETNLPFVSLGYLNSDQQMGEVYSASDLFVLPSLEDNLPNTMLEAMSCGTPVVGFEVGGLPDLIKNGYTGQLVPPGDTEKLGQAILMLTTAPRQLAEMGQICRQLIQTNYALPVQAGRYLDLYQDLLTTFSPPPGNTTAPFKKIALSPNQSVHQSVIDTTLGTQFQSSYDSILFKALKEFAPLANHQWQIAEADRAARLKVIEELVRRLKKIKKYFPEVRLLMKLTDLLN